MVDIPTIYGDDWGMVYGIAIPTLWENDHKKENMMENDQYGLVYDVCI